MRKKQNKRHFINIYYDQKKSGSEELRFIKYNDFNNIQSNWIAQYKPGST